MSENNDVPAQPRIEVPEPATPLPPRGTPCEAVLPNLAVNAMPLTPLLVAMVEYAEPVGLVGMRLRDSWLRDGAGGPQVCFMLHIGGGLRGGPNGALWGRLRRHPLYVEDQDVSGMAGNLTLKDRAMVAFLVPSVCIRPIEFLLRHVPYVRDTAADKMREAAEAGPTATAGPRRPPTVPEGVVQRAIADLVRRVETLRVEGLR